MQVLILQTLSKFWSFPQIIIKLQYSVKCLIPYHWGAQNKIITVIGTTTDYIWSRYSLCSGCVIYGRRRLWNDTERKILMKYGTLSIYIVGCRSDYCDNLILSSPVVRNKTFDGVLKFYYYCKLGYIIIHFVKLSQVLTKNVWGTML